MKQKYLFTILFAFACHAGFSQTTAIPDADFEAFLEANGMGNGIANDHLVTTANISTVTILNFNVANRPASETVSSTSNISDLTGIEDFAALEELNCNGLQLVNLDLTSNVNLKTLYASDNNLTALSVTGLTALEIFECERNQLETLFLNTNTALLIVLADNNALTSLHIKNGNNGAITAFRAAGNPNLSCITVNNASASYLNDWDKDNTTVFGESCGETSIPDIDFENFLEDNGMGNGIVGDNLVTTANISTVTNLNITYPDVADLTGIEDFTALISLNCSNSNITTMDISALTQLEILICSDSDLITLDVTSNTNLIELHADGIDVTTLDLSQNTALTVIDVNTNYNLVSLNIRNGNNMNITSIITVDTSLDCIIVDDPAYSESNWNLSGIVYSDVDCALTFIPDNAFLENLQIIPELDNSFIGTMVLTHKIAALTTLDVSGRTSIDNLTGLEDFAALEELDCSGTSITDLNVTQNTALTILHCEQNVLTSLDVSQNVLLTELYCNNNNLSDLELINNNLLEVFDCSSNQLTRLNLKNGNNGALTTSNLNINPNLTCIKVDDPTAVYLTTPIWVKDVQSSYDASCGETYVPDDNFEQALIDLGYDTGALDDYVPTATINTITSLDVGNQNIGNLTGIKDFVALTVLKAYSNSFTTIDVSNLSQLVTLWVHSGSLTALDVSANILLEDLRVDNNQLAEINLTNNPLLRILQLTGNNLTSIDVTTNIALTRFRTGGNPIMELDLSNNIALTQIWVNASQLTELNVKNGNNGIITNLNASGNSNLTCINVDNAIDAEAGTGSYSTWGRDVTASFGEHCYETNVPDDIFEAYLETHDASGTSVLVGDATSMGNGIADDNYVTTSAIENVISLVIPFQIPGPGQVIDPATLISNLTGLEGFRDLVNFDIRFQNIANLDVTENMNLETLTCYTSKVEIIDVSTNLQLESLILPGNEIEILDVTNNTQLRELQATNNDIADIDLSNNVLLEEARFNFNKLDTIDLSNNTLLTETFLNDNLLTSVNLKNGNNGNITSFNASGNSSLTCILVDNALDFEAAWQSFVDPQTSFNDVSCDVQISPKVFLQGALLNPNTGEETLMRDDLREAGYIDTNSPYDLDSMSADVLNITGDNAIVDWVLIELRDANDATLAITNLSALLQRDGDIVSLDGISPVNIKIPGGDYYISIKHRNHLEIMTATTIALSNTVTIVDFTDANNQITYGTNAQTTFGMPTDVVAMWAGNVNGDTIVQYSGTDPDVTKILSTVLNDDLNFLNFPTYSVFGYNIDDINMDGSTQYSGTNPDTPFILQNVLAHPGNFLNFSTYQIIEQLPEN